MVPHCGFDLNFSDNKWSEHLFLSLLAIYMFLWRNVCLVLWPIFWLGCLFFGIELRISEINSLSVASLAVIFSHSDGCLFTLLTVSFIVQKLWRLIRSHLFLLLFPLLWEVGHRGPCCDLYQSVLLKFSSRSFIASGLRSLIHFEFIFVYGVKKCSSFILLLVGDQFSQHQLLKIFSFLNCIFLPHLSKMRCPLVPGFISRLSICSNNIYFSFCASTILSWWL